MINPEKMTSACYFVKHYKLNMDVLKSKYFSNQLFLKDKFLKDFQFKHRICNYTDIYTIFEEGFSFTNDSVSRTLEKDAPIINILLEQIETMILLVKCNNNDYDRDYQPVIAADDEFMNFFKIKI